MRVILRADAGVTQGTGHVMRLLTLAEALAASGHESILATAAIEIPWLSDAVSAAGVEVIPALRDHLDAEIFASREPDWVVVDSYLIPAEEITEAAQHVRLLLLADGTTRATRATLYLDQNLGAETRGLPGTDSRSQLLGADYALVRSAFTSRVPADPVPLRHDPPHVVVVLGGTDPHDKTVEIAKTCARVGVPAAFTFVAQARQHDALVALARGSGGWEVLAPTSNLPGLLADADVVVSAAGTTAWDVCTLGIPTLLFAVADNQQDSLAAALAARVALGADLVGADLDAAEATRQIETLITDRGVRARLTAACRAHFDGMGSARVVAELERRLPAPARPGT